MNLVKMEELVRETVSVTESMRVSSGAMHPPGGRVHVTSLGRGVLCLNAYMVNLTGLTSKFSIFSKPTYSSQPTSVVARVASMLWMRGQLSFGLPVRVASGRLFRKGLLISAEGA